ncbi:MAG: hypothetical protein EOR04_04905 [Mesorhizobium sp.]|uniref:hypothetical protein n=1 Tax=Mesorhizobium sp. TaxID=1871066 RepID=UPI000FE6B253|nr:hypothetical protein [Mesorhizobium sp.]RWP44261.1 MAG: hypothetical protein EOR04_04905 [Mesorhizobium sp.]
MDDMTQAQREAMALAFRNENRRSFDLEKQEIEEFSKAATRGQGNRKERRRQQAELKKMWRR